MVITYENTDFFLASKEIETSSGVSTNSRTLEAFNVVYKTPLVEEKYLNFGGKTPLVTVD
jgi:hypothetical protein